MPLFLRNCMTFTFLGQSFCTQIFLLFCFEKTCVLLLVILNSRLFLFWLNEVKILLCCLQHWLSSPLIKYIASGLDCVSFRLLTAALWMILFYFETSIHEFMGETTLNSWFHGRTVGDKQEQVTWSFFRSGGCTALSMASKRSLVYGNVFQSLGFCPSSFSDPHVLLKPYLHLILCGYYKNFIYFHWQSLLSHGAFSVALDQVSFDGSLNIFHSFVVDIHPNGTCCVFTIVALKGWVYMDIPFVPPATSTANSEDL